MSSLDNGLTTPPTTPPKAAGVAVTITATPVAQPDGSIELCPPGTTGACPGILHIGDLDPGLVSAAERATVVRVTGTYDGRTVTPSADPEVLAYPLLADPDFSSLCPGLRGTSSVNPDEDMQTAIAGYIERQSDFAEMWWDRESAILTVWFKGEDVASHQTAIETLANGEPVCVAGGAQFSQVELMEASDLIQDFRDSRGEPLATAGYAVGGLDNRINLSVEEIDSATRVALTDLVGDRVVIYPFIEMLDGDLSAMPAPVPVVEGDVDILTNNTRNAGGMAALGHFTLSYDPDLNCVYFGEANSTERIVPVWPFGYSATSEPLTIHDFDGAPIAVEGDQLELGGGNVGVGHLEGNTCDATSAWIVSGF